MNHNIILFVAGLIIVIMWAKLNYLSTKLKEQYILRRLDGYSHRIVQYSKDLNTLLAFKQELIKEYGEYMLNEATRTQYELVIEMLNKEIANHTKTSTGSITSPKTNLRSI